MSERLRDVPARILARRIALLEEHANRVQQRLEEVLSQQARLAEKITWYRSAL
ncbi:hypothetical protein [Microbacterium sp. AK031]|uniref:hypothetical protein n=1 Tax=Microbacterium sp. AK031 TaxID=2723076 RepID=UPI002169687E|nr:hypothetical protein [Microbacterium sp. AK031]MCS3844860.1 hypothetical protein [Microbacterium sp. AK031]